MIVDARGLDPGSRLEADVCIIGAGAAGITLARALGERDVRVCLLESGGLEPDAESLSLNRGESVGLDYFPLSQARLRFLGGTTNHWAGWCRPLDALDFEVRDWIPHSGWPLRKSDLVPFYERAQPICQLGPYRYAARDWTGPGAPALPFASNRFLTRTFQLSPPTRFGETYRADLEKSETIRTLLYANCIGIQASPNGKSIARVQAATLTGRRFTATAKHYILATGAIENARVLLASGLGNANGLVGRYFMDHVEVPGALLLPSDPDSTLAFYRPHEAVDPASTERTSISGVLAMSPELQRDEKLASVASTELERMTLRERTDARFHESARGLEFASALAGVVSDVDAPSPPTGTRRAEAGRNLFRFSLFSEQVPNPDSRVTLSDERDALGMQRVRLDWQITDIERRSIRRAYALLAQSVGQSRAGRLRVDLPADEKAWRVSGQWHQLGTTRMHADPLHGVVDANCRVHGIANLFVAGSSVFPTSGTANPTLTLVALALRLADHVHGQLTGSAGRRARRGSLAG